MKWGEYYALVMSRTAKTTPETCNQIAQAYIAGELTLRQIARKFCHTDATVRGILAAAQIPLRRGGEIIYNRDDLRASYEAGATMTDLAVKFGGCTTTIRKALEQAGATIVPGRRKTELTHLEQDSMEADASTVLERYRNGASVGAIAAEFGVSAWYVRKFFQRHNQELRAPGLPPKYATKRQRHLGVKYGLTEETYAKLLAAQGGICAICRVSADHPRNSGYPSLCVDHCHLTQRVRGLLCASCNSGLGQLQDQTETVVRAAAYMTNWPTATHPPEYVQHVNVREARGGHREPVITPEHVPQLVEWVAEKRTVVFMATELGVTPTTIHKALRRFELYTKKVTITEKLTPLLPEIASGMSLEDAAAQLGVGVPTVRSTMSAMGVSLGSLRALQPVSTI